MKTAVVDILGVGAVSFSRRHETPFLEGENHDAHDKRTWKEKLHYQKDTGYVYIPGICFKFALDWTAKQVGMKIAGRRGKTWGSVFQSGVTCTEDMLLYGAPITKGNKDGIWTKDDVLSVPIWAHSNGRRGSASRVPRIFPILEPWYGTTMFYIMDDTIDEAIFVHHLIKAGQINGMGRYAARVGGTHGRFEVTRCSWQDDAEETGLLTIKPQQEEAA